MNLVIATLSQVDGKTNLMLVDQQGNKIDVLDVRVRLATEGELPEVRIEIVLPERTVESREVLGAIVTTITDLVRDSTRDDNAPHTSVATPIFDDLKRGATMICPCGKGVLWFRVMPVDDVAVGAADQRRATRPRDLPQLYDSFCALCTCSVQAHGLMSGDYSLARYPQRRESDQ